MACDRKVRVIRVGWVIADPTTTAYAPAARHAAAWSGVPIRPSAITGTAIRLDQRLEQFKIRTIGGGPARRVAGECGADAVRTCGHAEFGVLQAGAVGHRQPARGVNRRDALGQRASVGSLPGGAVQRDDVRPGLRHLRGGGHGRSDEDPGPVDLEQTDQRRIGPAADQGEIVQPLGPDADRSPGQAASATAAMIIGCRIGSPG